MNKSELVNRLQETSFLKDHSKKKVTEFVDHFFNIIATEVAYDEVVSIPGFGKFYKFTSSTTGKKSPKFVAFKDFKESVQG